MPTPTNPLDDASIPPPLPNDDHTDINARNEVRQGQVYEARNGEELQQHIQNAKPRDTIVITRKGNYGSIRVTNKRMLRIKSYSINIPVQIGLIIDGHSKEIIIENIQLWNTDHSLHQIVISGPQTDAVIIRGCIISSVPLNQNSMRQHYSGNPLSWINGVRLLGSNSQITNNHLMNLKIAIVNTGVNTLVQHNLVQYFSEDAIRVTNHGTRVLNNNIYDSVAANPNQNAHKDAIQMIPPADRYNGGPLNNVQIIGNIIQSHTQPGGVPANERGIVQGIFGSDGYFVNTTIVGNTIIVNSDHGISLNGVLNLNLHFNRTLDVTPGDNFNPGVKLYLTRLSQNGQQRWLANRPYSLSYEGNQGPILNIPREAYISQDLGNNRFLSQTDKLARGVNPIIVRGAGEGGTTPLLPDPVLDDTTSPVIMPSPSAPSSGMGQTYVVANKAELDNAAKIANNGDSILIRHSGDYGQLRLTNKNNLRIRAQNPDHQIQCHILIDGNSKNIILENMNLWFSESNWKPVILSAPTTSNITIRNCLVSSVAVKRADARARPLGTNEEWITGIWLRGDHNEIVNNHIVNMKMGVVVTGKHNLIQNNLIQYFSETAVRVFNDHCIVQHNNIYDTVAEVVNSRRLKTGIQLIPAKHRFSGGEITDIDIKSNVIQSRNSGSIVSDDLHGLLQGITCHDGYFVDGEIVENTIVVNTPHGIAINGANKLELNKNRVFDSSPQDRYTPGIRLYLTRTVDIDGNRQQTWHTEKAYSISFADNQAPVFNVPRDHYIIDDRDGNQFSQITRDNARGVNPAYAP